jgi:predicted MPP superfamily phosphohydrolase
MQDQRGLRPDLIFFTGDAAYGQVGSKRGELIADQFREAHDFLEKVRTAFSPEVEQRNVFLVPGNHDVNRTCIAESETFWLEQAQSLDKIERLVQSADISWQRILERLNDYESFLDNYGYDHLLTGRERLIYADAREVAGVRIGIAGFNSAWSSTGAGRSEKGKLWMAGRFQLETLLQALPPNDFAIALMHHPSNWLVSEEDPDFDRDLKHEFPFVLHGHEQGNRI